MLTLCTPPDELFRWSSELIRLPKSEPPTDTLRPDVDVVEEEQRYLLRADLPGFEEKDIDLRVVDGALILSGKREQSREQNVGTVTCAERRYGSFCRQFALGGSVDESKIEASYKNGVLTVALPKRDEAKPRQIPVHAT